jgi:muramoyltetrapeptide carboxypeptidase
MKWNYLNSGAIVDIIAPSFGKKRKEKFYLNQAFEVITRLGFTPRCSDNFIDCKKSTFSANSDEYRYQDFKRALYCPDSKAIWAFRGGYGANKILPQLIKDSPPPVIKPLIGFSDITFLSNFLFTQWNIPSIHGPVLSHYFNNLPYENLEAVRDLLNGSKQQVNYEIFPQNSLAVNSQNLSATLIGGNVMLIENTLATPWQINSDNKIIFFEEVNERGYALDRTLTHLIDANFFLYTKAIIFGDIIAKKERNGKDMCVNAIEDFAKKIKLPVYLVKNIGHGSSNFPLPIGTAASISLKENKYFLTVESGGKYA